MKVYRTIMKAVTWIEETVMGVALVAMLILEFANVIGRYFFHHAIAFTDELVMPGFVLITMLGAAVAAREPGGLVNLALISDHVKPAARKVLNTLTGLISIAYCVLLSYEGFERMKVDTTKSSYLHIPNSFWGFIFIGGICLALHFVQNIVEFLAKDLTGNSEETEEDSEEEAAE